MTPAEARRAAERAFGNKARIAEDVRAVTIPVWFDRLAQDLRYAWRGFRRAPAFALAAVAALTVGIGTAAAVFSFADRILFRPLPYVNERELVWFGMTAPIGGGTEFILDEKFVIHPLRDRQVRDSERAAQLLLGAVILLLLIAIANVANLLLARAAARRREQAVRAAIGAGKSRLIRQTLTESLLLGLIGGGCGLLAAVGLLRVFRALAPAGMARLGEATVDWRIATVALLATLSASVLFGLAPALQTPAPEALMGGRVSGSRRQWLRPALVISQIGLSLVLLCGASLLVESLRKMAAEPLGMETTSLFSAYARLPETRYEKPEHRAAFWRSVEERVAAVPGVQAVAIADSLPPEGQTQGRIFSSIYVEGTPRPVGQPTGGMVTIRQVSPSYFGLLGIAIRQGRLFTESSVQTVVLSEQMAARVFPGETAVGRRLVFTGEGTFEVVAVVANVRNGGLKAGGDPELYLLTNRQRARQFLVVRADTRTMPFVREALRELDPRLPVELQTLDDRVRRMRARPLFQSTLLGGFAVAGLLLAAIGLYGVMALLAAQRRGEIGIRMALGATPANVLGLVLGQAARWTVAGIAVGLAGCAACARLIEGLLFGVKATALLPLLAAVGALALAAVVAAWLPARRAARVLPVEALRQL